MHFVVKKIYWKPVNFQPLQNLNNLNQTITIFQYIVDHLQKIMLKGISFITVLENILLSKGLALTLHCQWKSVKLYKIDLLITKDFKIMTCTFFCCLFFCCLSFYKFPLTPWVTSLVELFKCIVALCITQAEPVWM